MTSRQTAAAEPFGEALRAFETVLTRARATPLHEPAAAVLATADAAGRPSARVILLRGFDERGFVFFTNSHSRKGKELAQNSRAALCFYWDPLHEQARVEGTVSPTADSESDAYWATRPRESQIGAWASEQSQILSSREALVHAVRRWEEEFHGRDVPRPAHWHGYRLAPDRIEFWQGLPARLHERTVYQKAEQGWTRFLLYP